MRQTLVILILVSLPLVVACHQRTVAGPAAARDAVATKPVSRAPQAKRLDGPWPTLRAYCQARQGQLSCAGTLAGHGATAARGITTPFGRVDLIALRHHRDGMKRCALAISTRAGLWVGDLTPCLIAQGHSTGTVERFEAAFGKPRAQRAGGLLLRFRLHLAPDNPQGPYTEARLRFHRHCHVDAKGAVLCAATQVSERRLRRFAADGSPN